MPQLSVIIPTHKRASILGQCLDHIERQTVKEQLEVIVVSDGHDDETSHLFVQPTWTVPLQFLEIEKSQQGIARNRGVERASGSLTLFIGDDIFLAPDACEHHIEAQQERPRALASLELAVLGFTTWDPAVGVTPVMRWLEKTGWQFGYPLLARHMHALAPANLQHRVTYTSNLSLPTDVARRVPFREDVSLYGWEDVEWGLRLRDAGVRLFYEPDAKALHHHRVTLEESLARMETLGRSVVPLARANPSLDRLPRGAKLLAYRALALLPTMRGTHARAFLQGIAHA
jgi:glycosyltransferase involved in cell wall biosynthesis